jgi:hypothetical protein
LIITSEQVIGVLEGTLPMLVVELKDELRIATMLRPVVTKDSRSVCLRKESQELRQETRVKMTAAAKTSLPPALLILR